MSSLAVRLPIARDSGDGFEMIKDFKTLIKQNFKMLLLTNPGERVMHPSFGAGIPTYLFESFDESTFSAIEARVLQQVSIYLPVIEVKKIDFGTDDIDMNTLSVSVVYRIPSLNVEDLLEFTI